MDTSSLPDVKDRGLTHCNRRLVAIFSSLEDFNDADHPVEHGLVPHHELYRYLTNSCSTRPALHPGVDELINLARSGHSNVSARAHRSRILSNASTFHGRMERLEPNLPAPQLSEVEQSVFRSFCRHGLWATAIERSFLPSQTSIDFQKYKKASSHILVDEIQAVYKVLERARTENEEQRRVDIVLDGDGIELSDNLLLAVFLLERQLATKVVLHAPRSLQDPVVPITSTYFKDFATVYQLPEEPDNSGDGPPSLGDLLPRLESGDKNHLLSLNELLKKWQNKHEGALTLQEEPFWSYWYSFWELQEHAPEILKQFQEAEVVIVRGDFNYRKLTEDVRPAPSRHFSVAYTDLSQVEWPASTPFATAIGPMAAEYGIRTLSLRTIESNSVVGLKEGQDTTLRKEEAQSYEQAGEGGTQLETRRWTWNRGFVLMQFYDGKAM